VYFENMKTPSSSMDLQFVERGFYLNIPGLHKRNTSRNIYFGMTIKKWDNIYLV
jgi:hypothetical protein